jgi:hypothetical protein
MFRDLPSDPEEAFLIVEASYWAEMEREPDGFGSDYISKQEKLRYITRTLAALNHFGFAARMNQAERPSFGTINDDVFWEFFNDVAYLKEQIRLKLSQRMPGDFVSFDEVVKRKVRHHLDHVRAIIESAEIESEHKARLLERLNAFSTELDRELSSIIELFKAISGLIYGAKKSAPSFPTNEPPKRIEYNKGGSAKPASKRASDKGPGSYDDIPF